MVDKINWRDQLSNGETSIIRQTKRIEIIKKRLMIPLVSLFDFYINDIAYLLYILAERDMEIRHLSKLLKDNINEIDS